MVVRKPIMCMGRAYYHPGLKRFLNRDILRGDVTEGQTFNRFAYVNGDPVGFIDPLGLAGLGTGQCKKGNHDQQTEKFYRGMSEKEFKKLEKNEILTKRPEGKSELKITDDPHYGSGDLSKRKSQKSRNYTRFVEFEVKPGTKEELIKLGGTHGSARVQFPNLPEHREGLVEVKFEKRGVLSLGLGPSKEGLDLFNKNILSWREL
ncbi:RHS repeat-associated core domain-containing protein [Brevibacillus laterosporus]|nr:RHS repeat-associated core domain-containing protein [Brevibacillus laterosporus]